MSPEPAFRISWKHNMITAAVYLHYTTLMQSHIIETCDKTASLWALPAVWRWTSSTECLPLHIWIWVSHKFQGIYWKSLYNEEFPMNQFKRPTRYDTQRKMKISSRELKNIKRSCFRNLLATIRVVFNSAGLENVPKTTKNTVTNGVVRTLMPPKQPVLTKNTK